MDPDLHAKEGKDEDEEEEEEQEGDDGLHAGQQGHHQVPQARPVPGQQQWMVGNINFQLNSCKVG